MIWLVSRSRSSHVFRETPYVMAGLVPAIHAFAQPRTGLTGRDARNKFGHDDGIGWLVWVRRPIRNHANFGNRTLGLRSLACCCVTALFLNSS